MLSGAIDHHIIICSRVSYKIYITLFDRLSRVARQRNRKFKATNIRNDMTLLRSRDIKVTPTAKKSVKRLSERESELAED